MSGKRLAGAMVVLVVLAIGAFRNVEAGTRLDPAVMKVALHTTTPEENGFVDMVAKRVDAGTLPESIVDSTFQWARKKTRNKFQYFKRGLILRAADAGISL